MEEIINRIPLLTGGQLQTVFMALRAQYTKIFPAWEVVFLSVHKDPQLQKQELISAFQTLYHGESFTQFPQCPD